MTLSLAPTLIATHSPWRGEAAMRCAAVAPDAGMAAFCRLAGDTAEVAAWSPWPACSSGTAAGALECDTRYPPVAAIMAAAVARRRMMAKRLGNGWLRYREAGGTYCQVPPAPVHEAMTTVSCLLSPASSSLLHTRGFRIRLRLVHDQPMIEVRDAHRRLHDEPRDDRHVRVVDVLRLVRDLVIVGVAAGREKR